MPFGKLFSPADAESEPVVSLAPIRHNTPVQLAETEGKRVFCPNATFAFQVKNNEGCEIPFSYGLNHDPFYQYNQIAPKVTRVKHPSRVPEFADTLGWLFRKSYAENLLAWLTVTTPSVWGNIFAYRHGNRAALCMLDGHVEVLPPTKVIHELVWAEIYE